MCHSLDAGSHCLTSWSAAPLGPPPAPPATSTEPFCSVVAFAVKQVSMEPGSSGALVVHGCQPAATDGPSASKQKRTGDMVRCQRQLAQQTAMICAGASRI
jgi:hypothetical protein